MKKFLLIMLGIVAWVVAWVVIYDQVNVWLVRHAPGNSAYKLERLLLSADVSETPILGSSRAETCYAPSVLGTNVFNYGISGSCIRETLFHLRLVLERKTTGDVIVNLDPWGFAYYGKEKTSGFAGQYGLVAINSVIRQKLPDGLVSLSDWLPGIRFQGCLRANLTAWLNARKAVTKKVDQGAALIKRSRTEEEWRVIDKELKVELFAGPDAGAQAELDQIEQLLKERPGVRVFWVVAPASPSWKRLYTGMRELEQFLKRLKGQNHAVNLLMDGDFGVADFADPTHLNLDGATKFSQKLKQYIDKECVQ